MERQSPDTVKSIKKLSFFDESNVPMYADGTQGENPATAGPESSIGQRVAPLDAHLQMAERYRLAVVNAAHDNGLRMICTAGRSCAESAMCGFCPTGPLRPQPVDGYEQYPATVQQARTLWQVSLADSIPPHVMSVGNGVKVSSLGAMLLAAHPQGHSCVSAAFDGIFPVNIPHSVRSLSGVQSWARAGKFRLTELAETRLLLVARFNVTKVSAADGAAREVVHCFQLDAEQWRPFPEVTIPSFVAGGLCYKLSLQTHTFAASLKLKQPIVVDVGYTPLVSNECIAAKCSSMPDGMHYCLRCHWTVQSDGHDRRCQIGGHALAQDLLMRRAQIGDVLHATDVLLALMDMNVPAAQRTKLLIEYKDGSAQASFMRFVGYTGSDGVLSTWFEAAYDYFRPFYFRITFGAEPALYIARITKLLPDHLDPSKVHGNPSPDYIGAWDHVKRVHAGMQLPDDPVLVAYREVCQTSSAHHAYYMKRFTELPPHSALGFFN